MCDTRVMGSKPVVVARSLVKRFGEFVAVDGIDVEVQPGESFGFLGPNGAGKTSTMRMIGCVSPVTEGELRIFGLDPAVDGRAIRSRVAHGGRGSSPASPRRGRAYPSA